MKQRQFPFTKTNAIWALIIALFALTACGGDETPETAVSPQPTQPALAQTTAVSTPIPATVISDHIVTHAYPGAIILSHDGGGDRSQTIAAYQTALPQLTAQGYVFNTIFLP